MPKPFYAEATVEIEGEKLLLVLDFEAIDATEMLLKPMSYDEIINEMNKPNGRLSVKAKVVWGMLRKHHKSVSLDEATSLLFGEAGIKTGYAVEKILEAAFGTVEDGAEENPTVPSGA